MNVVAAVAFIQVRLMFLEILRLISRRPLYVATNARFLLRLWHLGRKHGIECGAQVMSVSRETVRGPAIIELAAIDEFLLSVE